MKRIKNFIKDNNLDFTGSGSDLNSNCVILAGFTLWVNGDNGDSDGLIEYLDTECGIRLTDDVANELRRVYDFAYVSNYAEWWTNEANRFQYKL